MVKPTHVSVAAEASPGLHFLTEGLILVNLVNLEASPVGQKQEGGNWICGLEGGAHCVAQESEHNFIVMRGMTEGEAFVAHRDSVSEGVCVCLEDLCPEDHPKIKDWREITYTDGSVIKHKDDSPPLAGSGVYKPGH
eukprot:1152804-Pelagomonas_calceolata.AAC.1